MATPSKTPLVDAAAERGSDHGLAKTMVSGIWPLARRLEESHARLLQELRHLVRLPESTEAQTGLAIPGLATLNGARAAIAAAKELA